MRRTVPFDTVLILTCHRPNFVDFAGHAKAIFAILRTIMTNGALNSAESMSFFQFVVSRSFPKIAVRIATNTRRWKGHPVDIIADWCNDSKLQPINKEFTIKGTWVVHAMEKAGLSRTSSGSFPITNSNLDLWISLLKRAHDAMHNAVSTEGVSLSELEVKQAVGAMLVFNQLVSSSFIRIVLKLSDAGGVSLVGHFESLAVVGSETPDDADDDRACLFP